MIEFYTKKQKLAKNSEETKREMHRQRDKQKNAQRDKHTQKRDIWADRQNRLRREERNRKK